MSRTNRKARISSIFLSLSLLLSLLSACKPEPQNEPTSPFSALDMASAISASVGDALGSSLEQLDDSNSEKLNTYMEAAYGMPAGTWAESAVIRASGAQAYEIAVIRFASKDQASHGVECLKEYLTAREGDFTGYAPEQALLVSNAVIRQEGLYAGLFICQEAIAAEAAFLSILETNKLPEPAPSPEPDPEPEIDMVSLMIHLHGSCEDEINALGNVGLLPMFDSSSQASSDYFLEIMATYYGVDTDQVQSGFNLMTSLPNFPSHAFQLTVLCMKNEEAAVQGTKGFQAFLEYWEDTFTEMELPEEAALAANGLVIQNGRYLALFVSQTPETVGDAFETALLDPASMDGPTSTEELQPVDMQVLAERLMAFCQDEIDETPNVERRRWPFLYSPEYIDEKQVEQGIQIMSSYYDGTGKQYAFELTVLYMNDVAAAGKAVQRLRYRMWVKVFLGYLADFPEQTELAKNGVVVQIGQYAALFVCRNPEDVKAEFESAIRELQPAETPQPSVQPSGPVFEEVERPEPQGEADPDHPGRIKFDQPNEVDMSLYDSSNILAAWKAGDPSSLSEEDQAIYRKATAVLDNVLQDGMSDYEKEVAVYDWMMRNISYDWSHADVLAQTDRASYTPYGGLVDGLASCLGVSTTFQLLMDMAGVECITVTGAAHSSAEDHAWNMVRLNGAWYCIDATWDINNWEVGGRAWRYFNVTSSYMARTNHQWDYSAVPEAVMEDHGQGATAG